MSEQTTNAVGSIASWSTAKRLTKARHEIGSIAASKKLGVGNGKYATLNDILPEINKVCETYGICYTFAMNIHETYPEYLKCILEIFSTDGDCEEIRFTTVIKHSPASGRLSAEQAMGGTLTYARRYAIMNAFGLSFDDEDLDSPNYGGNNNTRPSSSPQVAPKPAPQSAEFIPVAKWKELKEAIWALGVMDQKKWEDIGKHYKIKSADQIAWKVGEDLINIYNLTDFKLKG